MGIKYDYMSHNHCNIVQYNKAVYDANSVNKQSCFLVFRFLHGVRDEFTDDISETAVSPIFIGHE